MTTRTVVPTRPQNGLEGSQDVENQTKPLSKFVHGTLPSHFHTDPDLGRWECNSPYCTDSVSRHPDNGGPVPIVQGYEPWRGR